MISTLPVMMAGSAGSVVSSGFWDGAEGASGDAGGGDVVASGVSAWDDDMGGAAVGSPTPPPEHAHRAASKRNAKIAAVTFAVTFTTAFAVFLVFKLIPTIEVFLP